MKILFVHGYLASFTRQDLEFLATEHEVRELRFRRGPAHFIQSSVAAVRGALWADTVVAWFGTSTALVPFLAGRLFGRPCIVIAGGYDVAVEPAIAYGNMLPGPKRWIGRLVFRLATRVLAVSQAAARDTIANAGVPAHKVDVIVHGIADDEPRAVPPTEGRRSVLTVGIVNESNLARKGLATFVAAAHHLPQVPFVLVGQWDGPAIERLRREAPPNVEFTGFVDDAELRRRMESAAVYVQVSGHEAFGVALAEAMLCGCVPVVTEKGSLPEVVGDTGFYVPFGDARATADAISKALASPGRGALARQRIVTSFPRSQRRRRLLEAVAFRPS